MGRQTRTPRRWRTVENPSQQGTKETRTSYWVEVDSTLRVGYPILNRDLTRIGEREAFVERMEAELAETHERIKRRQMERDLPVYGPNRLEANCDLVAREICMDNLRAILDELSGHPGGEDEFEDEEDEETEDEETEDEE